jgi:glycopeptide antibiotics resistance protein
MLNKIAPDKWKHFFVGIAMGAVLQAFLLFLIPAHPVLTILLAFFFVVAISYGFELTSKITGRGHYDIMDAVASTIGGVLGMGITVLLKPAMFSGIFS